MIHSAHAHIGHGQDWRISQCGNFGAHSGAGSQRCDAHARAVHRFCNEGECLVGSGPNNNIIGFGYADLQFICFHRHYILPISLNHGHRKSRDTQVKERHRAAVDNPQPHPFAGIIQQFQIIGGTMPIDEISVGGSGNIKNVGRHHPHLAPHPAFLAGQRIVIGCGSLLIIEIAAALLFQFLHDDMRVHRRKFAKKDDIFAVKCYRVFTRRIDNDWAIMSRLFLQS